MNTIMRMYGMTIRIDDTPRYSYKIYEGIVAAVVVVVVVVVVIVIVVVLFDMIC